MKRFWKILQYGLLAFTVVAGALLLLASIMSDRLSKREALDRIMAADEPCRAAYAAVVERRGGFAPSPEVAELARTGEPACRASFKALDAINIFIPSRNSEEPRRKKAAIDDCALLSRVRADLLAAFAAPTRDENRVRALDAELGEADQRCQGSFERLAR